MVVACAAPLATACLQNHDILAQGPPGAGGTFAQGGAGGRAAFAGGAGGKAIDGGVADGAPAPDGPRALTVVHGVTDSPWIALCFTRVKSGVEGPATGSPLPSGGLKYGRTTSFSALPGIDLAVDGVRSYVVAGAGPEVIAGLDCAALVELAHAPRLPSPPPASSDAAGVALDGASSGGSSSGGTSSAPDGALSARDGALSTIDAAAPQEAAPPPFDATTRVDAFKDAASSTASDAALDARGGGGSPSAPGDAAPTDSSVSIPAVRVVALPVVPEGQLATSRGYLLALGGCIGGPGVTDPSSPSICGPSYTADTPTLSPILVALSRTAKAGKVALGFLDATPAVSHCDLRLAPPPGADPIEVASDVVPGALRPRPPTTASAVDDIASASIQVYSSGATTPAYDQKWTTTLDAGGLTGLSNGSAYTLVLIGPYPGFAARRWWNDPLVTIVKN